MSDPKITGATGATGAAGPDQSGDANDNPSRLILETDSAKYTNQISQTVVRNLYLSEKEKNESAAGDEFAEAMNAEPPKEEKVYRKIESPSQRAQREKEEAARAAKAEDKPAPRPMAEREPKKSAFSKEIADVSSDDFTHEDFLRNFENSSRSAGAVRREDSPRTFGKEKRTFSHAKEAEERSGLESLLSSKKAKGFGAEKKDESQVSVDNKTYRKITPQASYNSKVNEEYVNIKEYVPPGKSGKSSWKVNTPDIVAQDYDEGYTSDDYEGGYDDSAYEEEKVPLSMPRAVEGKPKKTSGDYRKITKKEIDKPQQASFDYGRAPERRGVNLFATLFMIAAILIIAVLVWRITILTKDAGSADDMAVLETKVNDLTNELNDKDGEIASLQDQIKILTEENQRLALTGGETPPAQDPAQTIDPAGQGSNAPGSNTGTTAGTTAGTAAQTPSGGGLSTHPDLENGEYTIKSGDTLYVIAEKYMGDGQRYPELAEFNGMQTTTPLIPGRKLKIPE